MNKNKDLKNLTRNEIIDLLEKNCFSGYRGEQIFNWIYKNGVNDFNRMNNLPGELISFLKEKSFITNLNLIQKTTSEDGTIKYLWQLKDEETIESVYLPYEKEKRHSVCISSQVGCNLSCQFCATGLSGLKRNLQTAEIIDQVLKIQQDISVEEFGIPPITNIVFMGMGEPLQNLDNVLKAIKLLNSEQGLNIGMRKITVSTAGIIPGIYQLAEKNLQIGLAVSLNAPNNKLRNQIMPVNKKFPLDKLLKAVDYYIKKTNRRVTFEYVLLKNINDSIEQAYQLTRLLGDLKRFHINLIAANKVSELKIEPPEENIINRFASVLKKKGIRTTIRQKKGSKIKAACGQLQRLEERRNR